ncbi:MULTISPECIES: hypothetical protein [Oceanobacillus]|uniref:Uncharacterized protein n=1 Tax=Oceanobacillus kimchii TaxID=746691 RepID=A0ABQ5TT71_9BACI|nr:hypothetical protein [Oceanobacillus kimchii]GLO68307.1 hypothetical protein MACH08_40910 [Oceanobacillus kimchii]
MTLTKNKSVFMLVISLLAVFCLLFVFEASTVNAATGAFDEVSGVSNSGGTEDAVYNDLNRLVNIVMAVGGFWVLACLIFAGIKLSGAQGNPQNRTQGFIGLGMAAVGGWVVVQARTVAGWIGGFGASS